jgi:hypothetical protein
VVRFSRTNHDDTHVTSALLGMHRLVRYRYRRDCIREVVKLVDLLIILQQVECDAESYLFHIEGMCVLPLLLLLLLLHDVHVVLFCSCHLCTGILQNVEEVMEADKSLTQG